MIMVTGAAGFIGSHLYAALTRTSNSVIGVDDFSTSFFTKENCPHPIVDCKLGEGLLNDHVPDNISTIFHVAARARIPASIKNPDEYYRNNILSLLEVLEFARLRDVKRVIYSSSSSVSYLNNPYAHSKLIGEEMCKLYSECYGIECISLRYFNVFGARMARGGYSTVLQKFIDAKASGDPLVVHGDGLYRRDFTYVGDVVFANISAMNCNYTGYKVYDVGSGKNYSILQIAKAFNHPILHVDVPYDVRRRTLADIQQTTKDLNYVPAVNVLDWIKNLYK